MCQVCCISDENCHIDVGTATDVPFPLCSSRLRFLINICYDFDNVFLKFFFPNKFKFFLCFYEKKLRLIL
jgi:hypothetical protein